MRIYLLPYIFLGIWKRIFGKLETYLMNMDWMPRVGVQIQIIAMWNDESEEEVLLSVREKFKAGTFFPIVDSLISELTKHAEAYSLIANLLSFFSEL